MSSTKKVKKPRHKIWDCFTEVREENRLKGKCRYCGATYFTYIDKMQRHILKQCDKIPENDKQKYENDKDRRLTLSTFSSSSQFTGKFCWEEIGGVAVPFIIRGSGEMLAEISMLKKTAFKKQLEVLSEEVFQIACPSHLMWRPPKYKATKLELKLLNEINSVHCDYFFSKIPIASNTFLLGMGNAVQLYQLLEVFYKVVTENKIENPRSGYILIDESNTPIPFVDIQNIGIVVPLFFFECPATMSIKPTLEDHWPLTYLKLFCKLLCVQKSYYDLTPIRVVRLSDPVIPEGSKFTFITTLPANVKISELTKSKILPETFKKVTERKIRSKVNKLPENISKQPDEIITIDDNDEETFTIDSDQDERVASKKTVPNILKSKNPVLLKCIQVDPRKSSKAEKTLTVVKTTSSPTFGGSRIKQNSSQSPKTRNKSLVVSRVTKIVRKKTSSATQSTPEPEKRNQHIKPITSPQKKLSNTSNTSIKPASNLVSPFTGSSVLAKVNTFPSTSEESSIYQNLSNSPQNKKISRVVSRYTKIAPKTVIKISIPESEKVCNEATSETSAEAQENLSTTSITPASDLVSPSTASTSSSAPPMVNMCTLTSGETVMEQNVSNITATVGCVATDSGQSLLATPSPMYTLSSGGFFIQQNLSDNSQTSIPSSLSTASTTSSTPTLLNTPPGTFLLASGGPFIQSNLCNSAVVPSANSIVSSTPILTSSTPIMSNISHHSLMLSSGGSLIQSNLSNTLQTSSMSSYNVVVSSTASTTSATPTVLNKSELLPVVPFTQSTSNTASNLLVRSSTLSSTFSTTRKSTEIISIGDSNPTKNIEQSSNIVVSSTISTSSSSSAVSNIAAPTVTLTPEGLLIKNSSTLDNTSLLQCNPYSYNILPSQLGLQVEQPSGLVAAQSTSLGTSQGMVIQPQAGDVAQGQHMVQQSSLGANSSNSFIIVQQQDQNVDAQSSTLVGSTENLEKHPSSLLKPRLTVLQTNEDVILVDDESKNETQPKVLLQAPPLPEKQQQSRALLPQRNFTPSKVACPKRKRQMDIPVKLSKKTKKLIIVSKSGKHEALYKVNEIPESNNLAPSSCYRIQVKKFAGRDFVCINILPTRASEMLINILEIREKLFSEMDKETFMTIAFQMKLEIFSLNSAQKASLESYYSKVKEPVVKEYLYFYFIKFFYVYDEMKKFAKMK